MKAIRWIAFIPLGILLGFVFALPIVFFYKIWNLDNLFWASVVKNGFNIYFMVLCMAWIVPDTFSQSSFKTLISIMFGFGIAFTSLALLNPPSGEAMMRWEYAGEGVGTTLGFLSAIKWDKHSIKLLLSNAEGVHPYNTHSHN